MNRSLAEREQSMAVALTELDQNEFSEDDAGRLLALRNKLPADLSPLADMLTRSLNSA